MIQTPWGPVPTPLAVLPYFHCPNCDKDVNLGDCVHNRQDFTPPIWIREFALWRKGEFEVEGDKLRRFEWLKDNAVVFSDGFESNDYSAWTGTTTSGGTIATASDQAREGTYSSKATVPVSGNTGYCYKNLAADENLLYTRIYIRWDSNPPVSGDGITFLRVFNAQANNTAAVLVINVSGAVLWRLRYRSAGGYVTLEGSNNPVINTWYSVEIKVDCSTADGTTDGSYQVWINGLSEVSVSSIDTDYIDVDRIELGIMFSGGAPYTVWCDSVIVDDASYIGPIAAGWTHKILGIANANISKVNGVAKANIAKVNGV